ncbi:acyl-CoA thioesterase [Hugenholtzia roseola]|uniref:acyl-CoA thioesterase n=1 Tax=Hugenholtzia roseola TaxID=1002 RepID=UPI00040A31C6|nr:thioesterase family protein [Hugenholtzia roseola]
MNESSHNQNPNQNKDRIDIIVRGYHLDVYQHVNNARYLEFMEEARWAYFDGNQAVQKLHVSKGLAFVIVNINISYRYPAQLGDVLEVQTFLKEIGTKSCTFTQKIVLKGTEKVATEAEVTFVFVDLKTQRAVAIDDSIRSILETMQSEA